MYSEEMALVVVVLTVKLLMESTATARGVKVRVPLMSSMS
jgi:hypothetical protein